MRSRSRTGFFCIDSSPQFIGYRLLLRTLYVIFAIVKHPSDESILQLIANDATKTKGFEQLVRKYSSPLYWQIRRMVLSHDDTDDVLQNTLIKAWRGLAGFRGEAKLSTWLYRIAVNESIIFIQHRKGDVSLDDSAAGEVNKLESDVYFTGDEIDLRLQQALATLPPKQRLVFNLKYFEDMKYEEMSDVLETSVGALKASYHLAVQKVRAYFGEHD